MLRVEKLYKNFDGVQAVHDFSLYLEPKKITSLIGPNGAGKTTLFNIITGHIQAGSGNVSYNNSSISNLPPWKINRLGLSRTFQNLRLFKRLTVLENVLLGIKNQRGELFLNALFFSSPKSKEHLRDVKQAEGKLRFAGLAEKSNELAENLSYGQQKLLSIACCISGEPDIYLLDEPVSGVQPEMIERISRLLKELVNKQGKTVFIIEHDMDFVMKISDMVVVMDEGKKIAEGVPSVIQSNSKILEAYLS